MMRSHILLSLTCAHFAITLPVLAHGGDEIPAPAGPWLAGFIILQLALVPIIGSWLIRWTVKAWRSPRPIGGGHLERNE